MKALATDSSSTQWGPSKLCAPSISPTGPSTTAAPRCPPEQTPLSWRFAIISMARPDIQAINIFSGSSDWLGAALTNPTELARRKGTLSLRLPVIFQGRTWPDVETAYLTLKPASREEADELMVELIIAKLQQHPVLLSEIGLRGGRPFLQACSHFTNARTPGFQAWEGHGEESRFIRNLLQAYDATTQGGPRNEAGQGLLF